MDNNKLDQIIDILLENKGIKDININDFEILCNEVSKLLLTESSLLKLEPPINICGDIHGQYNDLLHVFHLGGLVPNSKYLFLGDYVDRGDQSVEVITLLIALKLKYPNHIYLLRGNHESPEMTEQFGFTDECKIKINNLIINNFIKVFDSLPIAAIIGNQIFAVHGGLSPSLNELSDINNIIRPLSIPEEGILADLLWSDPSYQIDNWGPNDRGATITWGIKVVQEFLQKNNLKLIVRGHQLAQNGFQYPFFPNNNVITIFTASYYAKKFKNRAAFLKINENSEIDFIILPFGIQNINLQRIPEKIILNLNSKIDFDIKIIHTPRNL